jgi:integrase
VRRSYTDGEVKRPKNHEIRGVHLSPDVVELLGTWWGELARPADDVLMQPGDTKGKYLNGQVVLRRELYAALAWAGIPRVGPTREERTFHSLRHTYRSRRRQESPRLKSGRPDLEIAGSPQAGTAADVRW